ncbi:hypothetical protein F5H01DRAFT_335370 [Linnemannia elongata]|nr:hypothetical protein F5H01DRAFT_335370 [Linnemannia elongata]
MSYNDRKSAPVDEQATFGNQAPFASPVGPSAPHDPYIPIPTDVPPSYSAAPSPVGAAVSRNPQTFLPPPSAPPQGPNTPQHNPYSYNPPAGAPPPLAGGGLNPNSPRHHPQSPYFSPPPLPQQQYQQPHYGGAGPSTNYGATNNNNLPPPPPQGFYYDNNGQPYQPVVTAPLVPRAPHGRRVRGVVSSDSDSSGDEHHPHRRTPRPRRNKKKSGSCCSCCCLTILFLFLYCWYLIKSFAFPDYSCTDADNVSIDTMYVPLVSGLNFEYKASEEVSGNIVVSESETWDEKRIRIVVVKKAYSSKTLDQITHTLKTVNGTTVSRVHLKDTLSKDQKEKISKHGGCLRADVQIIYPRASSSFASRSESESGVVTTGSESVRDLGALSLSTISGEISVKMASSGAEAYSLDSLGVKVVHGDVEFNNLVVVRKTHVEIVNGQVLADLTTAGAIKVDMVNGGMGLTIDSAAPRTKPASGSGIGDWSPENLDVQVNAVNGPVSVTFRNHFHGHFTLESKVGSTSFTVPPGDRKTTPTNPSGKHEGWVSEDGKEPHSPLPRLVAMTAIGTIKVKVEPNNRYTSP